VHIYSKEASDSKIMSEDETDATWTWEIWLLTADNGKVLS
jgi:hypothetical protein